MAKRQFISDLEEQFKNVLTPSVSPNKYIKAIEEAMASQYDVDTKQAYKTATGAMMAANHRARQTDIELERLKKEIESSLIYGNGQGTNQILEGNGQGYSHLEDAFRYLREGHDVSPPPSGKEACPVLIRLLTELYINPAFSLKAEYLLGVS